MYLKSLILHGFKSFAQREEVVFPPGISGIVGPNGCGKSNILDAVRWVLGEQNIKNLRGNSLQDVIFAGTQDRKPLGMAEVSLILDNTDGAFGLEFAEISVTRRAYRSGDSEFFINNIPCRLKDIQELFMDTGLGRGSMAIVGQGEISAIISARPETRRELLEEVAGVSKYRHKRKDALERLQETAINLSRVEDIIAEVQSQLGPLQQEMERAKEYKMLVEKLANIEKTLLIDEWRKHKITHNNLCLQITSTQEELNTVKNRYLQWEESISDKQNEIELITSRADRLKSALNQLKDILQSNQGKIEVLKERISGFQAFQQRRETHLNAIETEISQLKEEAERIKLSTHQLQDRVNMVKQGVESTEEELNRLKSAITQKEKALETLRQDNFRHLQQIALAQSELGRATGNKEAALALVEKTKCELKTTRSLQHEQQVKQDQYSQEIQDLNQNRRAIQKKAKEIKERLIQLQTEEKKLKEKRDAHWIKFQEITSKRDALLGIINSYEGFADGVVACLKANESWSKGVIGPLGALLQVDQGYERAIEAALDSSTQHILVETREVAYAALDYLKKHQAGKATFFPLDQSAKTPVPMGLENFYGGEMIPALNLLKYDSRLSQAVSYYLSDVVVCSSLETCQKAHFKYPDFRFVSLEGELITPAGYITGGKSKGTEEESILSRKSRLIEFDRSISEAQNEVKQLDSLLQEMSKLRSDAENELVTVEKESNSTIKELQEKQRAHQLGQERLRSYNKAEIEGEAALAQAQKELDQATQAMERAQNSTEDSQKQCQHIEMRLQECTQELNQIKAEYETLAKNSAESRAELANYSSELKESDKHLEIIEQQILRLNGEKQQEMIGIEEIKLKIDQTKLEVASVTAQIESASEKALLTEKELSAVLLDIQAHKEELTKMEQQGKGVAELVSQHAENMHKLDLRKEREEASLEQICTRLKERNIPIPFEPDSIDPVQKVSDLIEQVNTLKESISLLGDVNLLALSDYNTTLTRYEFLCEQRNDLLMAKEGLDKAIEEMDTESTQRLQKTFESVQQALTSIFPRLFTGGKCELSWTEPTDLLSSGIEMMVQPPGKRPQPLITLSGGEQALAAIALLFSLMMVRPAPFFILDEIEAALDGANLSRFVTLLKEFGTTNQIIMVTHRQQSMECADVLYGVTTERYGASKLFSIDMQKAVTQFGS